MFWIFWLLAGATAAELSIGYRRFWPTRKNLAWLGISCGAAASGLMLVRFPGFGSAGLVVVTIYASCNMWRATSNSPGTLQMLPAISRTALWLAAAKTGLVYVVLLTQFLPSKTFVAGLAITQLAAALVLVISVHRQLRSTRPVRLPEATALPEKQLPSLTVAVPAAIGDGYLEDCLTAILASRYPKLEVLALSSVGDSSARASDSARAFAHAGVRFISVPPAKNNQAWQPKNLAYAALADNASGDYIVYMGSDIRLATNTLRLTISAMLNKHKTMMAVVPQDVVSRGHRLPPVQSMRYFWEMAPPRRLFRRPPVLSSFWIIAQDTIHAAGGFGAVSRSVTPEAHFAYHAMADNDSYSFVRSDATLGIHTVKSLASQQRLAVRLRYTQLHRRPELVALLTVGEIMLLMGPVPTILVGLAINYAVLSALSGLALAVNLYAFGSIQRRIFVNVSRVGCYFGFFASVIADLYYLNRSMIYYESLASDLPESSAQVRNKNRKG